MKPERCGERAQASHSERLASNSNLSTYCVTLGKLLKFSNFYFPIDKIEKIMWQDFCETQKIITETKFNSTNTDCSVPDHAFMPMTPRWVRLTSEGQNMEGGGADQLSQVSRVNTTRVSCALSTSPGHDTMKPALYLLVFLPKPINPVKPRVKH